MTAVDYVQVPYQFTFRVERPGESQEALDRKKTAVPHIDLLKAQPSIFSGSKVSCVKQLRMTQSRASWPPLLEHGLAHRLIGARRGAYW